MKDKNLFKDKIVRIFLRNGGEGRHVKLFDSLSDSQKKELFNFPLDGEEIPAIGGIFEDGSSMLLTTDNLFMNISDVIDSVNIREIGEIKFDLHSPQVSARNKSKIDRLKFVTVSGKEFLIRTEEGNPFFGLLNVLLFIQRNNKSQTQPT